MQKTKRKSSKRKGVSKIIIFIKSILIIHYIHVYKLLNLLKLLEGPCDLSIP